jgi:hypothetical protein
MEDTMKKFLLATLAVLGVVLSAASLSTVANAGTHLFQAAQYGNG